MSDDNIKTLIANMYDDRVPINKLTGLGKGFQAPINRLAVLLFRGNPATKEDSDKMESEATEYVNLMIAADVLQVVDKEKGIVTTGKKFDTFIEEVTAYLDSDNIIIRILGISRQEFDGIVNEYTKAMKGADDIDSILSSWSELPNDVKLGIIRGVFLQRSIMGGILVDLKKRSQATITYSAQTIGIIDGILGVKPDGADQPGK